MFLHLQEGKKELGMILGHQLLGWFDRNHIQVRERKHAYTPTII